MVCSRYLAIVIYITAPLTHLCSLFFTCLYLLQLGYKLLEGKDPAFHCLARGTEVRLVSSTAQAPVSVL